MIIFTLTLLAIIGSIAVGINWNRKWWAKVIQLIGSLIVMAGVGSVLWMSQAIDIILIAIYVLNFIAGVIGIYKRPFYIAYTVYNVAFLVYLILVKGVSL